MARRSIIPHGASGMHPISSLPDGIWITNAMLARALERLQHVYPVPRRCLSTCPGPLESRRRLGKRHMTAAVPHFAASPFPWGIELSVNLGQWTWEAPIPPQDRHKKQVGLFERFLRGLEDLGNEDVEPVIVTQPQAVSGPEPEPLSPVGQARADLNNRLVSFFKVDDEEALMKACDPYLVKILRMVGRRSLSKDDFILALDPFDKSFRQRASDTVLDKVLARQLTYIIHAIHRSRTSQTEDIYGEHVWHQCFKTVLQMAPQTSTFDCLDELLRLLRQYKRIHLDPSDYIELMRSHILLEVSQGEQYPTRPVSNRLLRRSMYICRMVVARGPVKETLEHLAQSCLEITDDDMKRHTILFQLLLKLAAVPELSTSEFTALVSNTHNTEGWAESEVFQLMALRFMTQTKWKIKPQAMDKWIQQPCQLQSWAAMLEDACHFEMKKRRANLKALYRTSDTFGHLGTWMKSMRLLGNHNEILCEIMKGEEDPFLVLAIWEFYNEGWPNPDRMPWYLWARHAEKLLRDPRLPPDLIWKIAEFHPTRAKLWLPTPIRGNISNTMDFLAALAQTSLKNPGWTTRQRLRFIEQAINWGKVLGLPMAQSLIQILAETLLQDLEEGKMGRKSRLTYLVSKIKQFYGREQADKVAVSLDGWRWTNKHRSGEMMRMPVATQTTDHEPGELFDEPSGKTLKEPLKLPLKKCLVTPIKRAWEEPLQPIGLEYEIETEETQDGEEYLELTMKAQRRSM
ncbi:hypothetical protein F53441_2507 [Fusarium austroafricanum]|uniref:Uncharacterized protein n=1 Tax=Fusarium austroafricanum TaxID=2364996 RepID=A0A8H4KTN5_9HYPO|nr:hypothetical protein F53441_2507 [Fusarium austroafricanum]